MMQTVSVITLTNGSRPEMLARAIRSVGAFTYPAIEHLVFDTAWMNKESVGFMRNAANAMAKGALIAHADDDDWSHPKRIEEQVALLQNSGMDAVGYRDMMFWDTTPDHSMTLVAKWHSEAWLYDSRDPRRFVGASMLYKRSAWDACPFHPDEPNEDTLWWQKNSSRCLATTSIDTVANKGAAPTFTPRMICAIHGANTSTAYQDRQAAHWRRVNIMDAHCAEVMAL